LKNKNDKKLIEIRFASVNFNKFLFLKFVNPQFVNLLIPTKVEMAGVEPACEMMFQKFSTNIGYSFCFELLNKEQPRIQQL